MKLQFYLGHPAHYHLFKNIIQNLKELGHEIEVLIKKKDVLEDLLKGSGISYKNILPEGRKDTKIGILKGMLIRDVRSLRFARQFKPDILIGTSVENSLVSKLLGIPCINVNEDDAAAVPYYAKFSYPWATAILSPGVCNNGKWESKSVKYEGYHELAYLHPNHFKPDISVVKKYLTVNSPYIILRFAKLTAHHDSGIDGLQHEIAMKLISILSSHGKILITSERELDPSLETYRLEVNPVDMHHLLAFALLYIGDSQTMAAEAGVLGTPFIRYNSFVGRLSYLDELENKYHLGFGIKPGNSRELFATVKKVLESPGKIDQFQKNREKMLSEKIDVAKFMTWFLDNYPKSIDIMEKQPDSHF